MPFSERVKHLAKRRAAFRCCVCHAPFVEVHHLNPEAEGGSSELTNAAPLCSSCHDLYGGNPEKRKSLRQMRDHWWELMDERRTRLTDLADDAAPQIPVDWNADGALQGKCIVIYHVVFQTEDFDEAAKTLVTLVRSAQERYPNRKRLLYLDIEGHRNKLGGFDKDMFELQRRFLMGVIMPYLARLHMPLGAFANKKHQRNDVPSGIEILKDLSRQEINRAISRGLETIWLPEQDASLRLPKRGRTDSSGREKTPL